MDTGEVCRLTQHRTRDRKLGIRYSIPRPADTHPFPLLNHPKLTNEPPTEQYKAPAPSEPLVSVLLHPDIKLLPPTYIAAPTKDPTHQETLFLHEEMKKQGVDADLVEWTGYPHFFWTIPMLQESVKFMAVWNEKLRGLIARA
jgi:acetyl esterase/lipase